MESSLEANASFQNLVLESNLVGLEGNASFWLHFEEVIIFHNAKKKYFMLFKNLRHVKYDCNYTLFADNKKLEVEWSFTYHKWRFTLRKCVFGSTICPLT